MLSSENSGIPEIVVGFEGQDQRILTGRNPGEGGIANEVNGGLFGILTDRPQRARRFEQRHVRRPYCRRGLCEVRGDGRLVAHGGASHAGFRGDENTSRNPSGSRSRNTRTPHASAGSESSSA